MTLPLDFYSANYGTPLAVLKMSLSFLPGLFRDPGLAQDQPNGVGEPIRSSVVKEHRAAQYQSG